ncbi:hypothetical protein [Paenibacillus piri]|uniref:Uncharacterized protein n=1 Tax=Paenibacillus piri TaxID=2547395 RepID=A0A4R5KZ46_9BACL|nr:hypothetical protein [Paenibacillus piri]TDG00903.1 hypothetical protein E1757_04640 [Paenibacillus piri]
MDKYEVSDVQREYLAILEKVDQLRKVGIKKQLYGTRDFTDLRQQIESIRDVETLEKFKLNGYLDQLINLTIACGEVCCKFVIKVGSPLQKFACDSCPIMNLENWYYDD